MNVLKSQSSSAKFKNCGLKSTVQRKLVFEILEAEQGPIAAEDIYLKIKEKKDDISLSTIYRILEMFVDKGIVIKTRIFNDKKFVFEINKLEHKHYLICTESKKSIEIDGCPLEKIEAELVEKTKYKIVGHKFDIYGYCPQCQKKLECKSHNETSHSKKK